MTAWVASDPLPAFSDAEGGLGSLRSSHDMPTRQREGDTAVSAGADMPAMVCSRRIGCTGEGDMTGEEFLQQGAELRRAQVTLRTEIAQIERSELYNKTSDRRKLMLRYESVTEQLETVIQKFLSG